MASRSRVNILSAHRIFTRDAPLLFGQLAERGFHIEWPRPNVLVAQGPHMRVNVGLHYAVVDVSVESAADNWSTEVDLRAILQARNPELLRRYQAVPMNIEEFPILLKSRARELQETCPDWLAGDLTDWDKVVAAQRERNQRAGFEFTAK